MNMAANWNSLYYVALESRDLQANAMALDATGTYILLAGRHYVAIRNLEEDLEVVQKFPRHNKYDVVAVEWNPTAHHNEMCIIASNDTLEVLTWRSHQDLVQTYYLKSHNNIVTDFHWHRSDPFLFVSCSTDALIHIWDLREARKPVTSLCATGEVSQVRWSKLSPNLLASSHDGDVKIWDHRKSSSPTQYIAAHSGKINGLDWSSIKENCLASCGQDNTVKIFDLANASQPENTITTTAPVWRAKFTPFGNGMVTVVVPPTRRSDNSLSLWDTSNCTTPVHSFIGHRDVVLDFTWRPQAQDDRIFQLITWSKDQMLLVWRVDSFLQRLCGHEPLSDDESTINGDDNDDTLQRQDAEESEVVLKLPNAAQDDETTKTTETIESDRVHVEAVIPEVEAASSSSEKCEQQVVADDVEVAQECSGECENPPQPQPDAQDSEEETDSKEITTPVKKHSGSASNAMNRRRAALARNYQLQQEFSLLNIHHSSSMEIRSMDVDGRYCVIQLRLGANTFVVLQVNFPVAYPNGIAPTFQVLPESNIEETIRDQLLHYLNALAEQRVAKNRACLETCLRQMVTILDQLLGADPMYQASIAFQLDEMVSRAAADEFTSAYTGDVGGGFMGPSHGLFSRSDENIPFPRTCGACFGGKPDMLVCFGRSTTVVADVEQNVSPRRCSFQTPRTMSALNLLRATTTTPMSRDRRDGWRDTGPPLTVSAYYEYLQQQNHQPEHNSLHLGHHFMPALHTNYTLCKPKHSTHRTRYNNKNQTTDGPSQSTVNIYDISCLFWTNKTLAEKYTLDGDVPTICRHNAMIAAQVERWDLMQAWLLLHQTFQLGHCNSGDESERNFWSDHPFGVHTIDALISHYIRYDDIQMVAMLCCVRTKGPNCDGFKHIAYALHGALATVSPSSSPYNSSYTGYDRLAIDGWTVIPTARHIRSTSLDNLYASDEATPKRRPTTLYTGASGRTAPSDNSIELARTRHMHEQCRALYADMLLRWGFFLSHAALCKYIPPQWPIRSHHQGVEFLAECSPCSKPAKYATCFSCKRLTLNCSVCHLSVRGMALCCLVCGHGGHMDHITRWFVTSEETECPTGCGCLCVRQTAYVLGGYEVESAQNSVDPTNNEETESVQLELTA